MSVLIKGMEMPKNCLDCGIAAMDEYGDSYCPFTNVVCLNVGRQDDCPLIEVPTLHGDLIERDKLREKEFIHAGDAYAVIMSRDIRNAPTIIEAEGKDINVTTKDGGT